MGSLFDNLGIRNRFAILLSIFTLGFAIFGLWSFKTLNELQVNGPLFQRIVQNKDLVADVLPPPAYIIESYLTVLQISAELDAKRRDVLTQTLQQLRRDYIAAHEKWKASGIGPELESKLLVQADGPAQSFYATAFDVLIPAAQREDKAGVARALQTAEKAYDEHRKAIDEVVTQANALVAQDQSDARGRIAIASMLLSAILFASLAASLGVAMLIVGSIVRPLRQAVLAAQTFASGDLTADILSKAARAGEQGRGFAVVASEVRALAGRSAEAAKEIKVLITASVDRARRGALLVDQAGGTMQEIVHSIKRVSDIVGEITLASGEQFIGVNQVGEAVTQMDRATQQNSALVEEMAAAAMGLKRQANELVASVALFHLPQRGALNGRYLALGCKVDAVHA